MLGNYYLVDQFNRDIDCDTRKRLGGGSYKYNLIEKSRQKDIYILRKPRAAEGIESCSIRELLLQIDAEEEAQVQE